MRNHLSEEEFAQDLLARALRSGADEAEVVMRRRRDTSVLIRGEAVAGLRDNATSAVGLRVFIGQKAASTFTTDRSDEALTRLIQGALELARLSDEDEHLALPDKEDCLLSDTELNLYSDDVLSLPHEVQVRYARQAEASALRYNRQIALSEGTTFMTGEDNRLLVNSHGFLGLSSQTFCSLTVAAVAKDSNGRMERGEWSAASHSLAGLAEPASVGAEAARRAVSMLGARKLHTQRLPVVFGPEASRFLVGDLFNAASGEGIFRSASFLTGRLGSRVASAEVDIIDDGTIPGGLGSSNFDGEGVTTRKTKIVDQGVLTSYALNSYCARRLGLKSTGNATRGLASAPKIGAGNLYMSPGSFTPRDILASISHGLFVSEFLGSGINLLSGSFSRGVVGFWIEKGEIVHPVTQVTVAGSLEDLLTRIVMIGNDLSLTRSSVAAPTICVEDISVAGT